MSFPRRGPLLAGVAAAMVAVVTLALAMPASASPEVRLSPDWQRYVAAPPTRDVSPVRVLSSTGSVTDPQGLLHGRSTRLSRSAPVPKPVWPAGTTAAASSFHDPNTDNGQPRTYVPGNAIDGNPSTFWNDANPDTYPAVLTLTSPQSVTLLGITVLSNSDGVPQDFTVDAWDGSQWQQVGSVTGNTAIQRSVPFAAPVMATQVRITVTKNQATGKGNYTRVSEVYPGLVVDDPAPSVTLDFGQVVVGYPKVDFAGSSADGTGVRLAFSESTQYLSDVSDYTRSGVGTDHYAVPAKGAKWTDTKGCQFGTKVCADGLHGFRYLKISLDALPSDAPASSPYGTVDLRRVSLDFTPFLGTPNSFTGSFLSSDDKLNQYWYNASYTNELVTDTFRATDVDPRDSASPTLEGKLVLQDGAKRDRDPYVGDIAVSGRTAYLTHNVPSAASNVLADLADHQRADGYIPPASIFNYTLNLFEYPLYWVTSSWDYMLYNGGNDYGTKYYPNLVKLMDSWYPSVTDAKGLLSKGLNNTGGYGDYGFLPRTGEVTYYNVLYVQALQDAAKMASTLGHQADADRWTQRAKTVGDAVNANLWDPSVGAYLDSATGPARHAQDGNSIAVTSGVAQGARATSALNYLTTSTRQPYGNSFMDNDNTGISDGTTRVYAFTSYPELEARFQSGQTDSAIDEINRLYGWMGSHDPGKTDWEGVGAGGSLYEQGFTSAAHGWSTGVLPALTNEVLGVQPTGPGFSTWTLTPHPGSVQWAQGAVPTPHGPIQVSWNREQGSSFRLTVTVPRGTSARLQLPFGPSQSRVDRVLSPGTYVLTQRGS
ncbi:MAG: alpha-L-rhamnosidase [Amycolatopsis sp.]|uniref:alpha-L-rhamnosidase C-terminal domain-containing protein n=1 Tax=Amycolatopsis sp. TaxID=37632 RepID=UPI0026362C26|nr:alpha-L-rhamnosidase C-terminal domain-containing protein [Amycolatopsis sp.]MCU1686398.1 alpha-L-rhamnosidase [Amycolatopsis sp.]